MKSLIFSFCTLFASFNSWANPTCYPFKANAGGFSRVCIDLQNPALVDSAAEATLYQGSKIFGKLEVNRSFTATHIGCFGKEHDCRTVPGSLSIRSASIANGNGVDLAIELFQSSIEKCAFGLVRVVNRTYTYLELPLACPHTAWDLPPSS